MTSRASESNCPDFAELLGRGVPRGQLVAQIAACFLPAMQRQARLSCGDAALAEDALQEAFATVLEALPRYRGDGPLRAWLRQLVRSACSRLRRGAANDPARHRPLEDDAQLGADGGTGNGAEWQLLWKQRLEILQKVLLEIPEPNRSLLLLREGQRLGVAELARRFSLTPAAVKSRLKRTRAELRRRLAAHAGKA